MRGKVFKKRLPTRLMRSTWTQSHQTDAIPSGHILNNCSHIAANLRRPDEPSVSEGLLHRGYQADPDSGCCADDTVVR